MPRPREPYAVVGAKGMLGSDLVRLMRESGISTIPLDVDELDIRRAESTVEVLSKLNPGVIINVAAVTDVDGCESDPAAAFSVNAHGAANLAEAARVCGAFMIHLSTDYVFDGTKRSPYFESDPLNPLGVYGESKAQGETAVSSLLPENHCIVRTQWLFGLNGKNFVEAILSAAAHRDVLKVVDDQRGSPTFSEDLAAALIKLSGRGAKGIVHVTNSGETTWYDFARQIVEQAGITNVRVEPITTEELGRPAPRPAYSVLDNSRFVELTGAALRSWEEALAEYLRKRREREG
ncbi:MAG: dTDP-4-dehydrorhamnose reductase [Desulfomonile tiedjei]|nr:dTDP-4-dehydrorhamnose reductase [Desulfomonile tiedjei]